MNFSHGYLLFGLALAAVPVVIHLLMRQKPKRLPFPAFRFLKQRYRVNQRKLNLQNFLLLALRVGVICALCLGLARPLLFAQREGVATDRPVLAVLVFDTSPSMEYVVAGVSRLDDSKARARELLDEMASGSSVVVIDSGDPQADAPISVTEARKRIDALRIRYGAGAINGSVAQALKFLARQDASDAAPTRVLYVLSDRTRASWDPAGVKPDLPVGVKAFYVDVGAEEPRDLAIEKVEVIPPVVAPGKRYQVRVRIRGTPDAHESELRCNVEGDARPPQVRPVKLAKGITTQTIDFPDLEAPEPPDGPADVPVHLTVRLGVQGSHDKLAINDERHATFLVRRKRKLLTIVDANEMEKQARDREGRAFPRVAWYWDAVVGSMNNFTPDYRGADAAAKELKDHPVVCLFQVTTVPDALWSALAEHVKAGGGLAIVPAGDELKDVKAFNDGGKSVLPAPLKGLLQAQTKDWVLWEWVEPQNSKPHPLVTTFAELRRTDPDYEREGNRPAVRRYWQLDALPPTSEAVARYSDRNVALASRGRVVLFTSPLDLRDPIEKVNSFRWDNYFPSSFGMVLIDRVCLFLGGETALPASPNFNCGLPPSVTIPPGAEGPFVLDGPGLAGGEKDVPAGAGERHLPQAIQPGNYRLSDAHGAIAGFSIDVAAGETDLDRVPVEQIEAVLGEGSVVQVGRTVRLQDALAGARRPPIDLMPYVMMALLLVLTGESLLANRFYRNAVVPEEAAPAGPVPT